MRVHPLRDGLALAAGARASNDDGDAHGTSQDPPWVTRPAGPPAMASHAFAVSSSAYTVETSARSLPSSSNRAMRPRPSADGTRFIISPVTPYLAACSCATG